MKVGLEYQELEHALRLWGAWEEEHYLQDSLPTQSSHLMIYCDHPPGHKILCAEIEKGLWKLSRTIAQLPHKHRDILLVWYAVNMKPTGGYWDAKEKAKTIGIRLNVLRMRVTRARRVLHKKIFLTDGYLSSTQGAECITVSAA